MLPYPNQHHFGFSQEPQHPNPSASSFPMGPPAAHLDQHHYDHFFPGQVLGHGHYFNSETLEAVLVRPPRVAAPERDQAIVVTAPQGARHNGVAAGAGQGQAGHQGHARARKRPFRTDRHSKIRTAQGVRDRRMRLSLDVARDFFALQDRLGFDKASKTVDWLLTQSKPAIDRLSAEPASHHHRGSGGGDAAMSSSPMSASEIVKDTAAVGSGGGGTEKADTRRNGASSSVFMDHGSCELDRLVVAAPVLGEYYYEFGEMMSTNGGEGDDDGEYDEDGDFLDGMQY